MDCRVPGKLSARGAPLFLARGLLLRVHEQLVVVRAVADRRPGRTNGSIA